MKNDTYKLIIEQADGTILHEEYSALICIKATPTNIELHIKENGALTEDWWRKFPRLLQSTIEEGLKNRRACGGA